MNAEPRPEHQWLQKLVGEWTAEMECVMGPDQPPSQSTATETVRPLGGLWTMGEGRFEGPDGLPMTSYMTLGFDPMKNKFVGTFVASMMTFLWVYEGTLDASGKVLTLDTEGPDFGGGGGLVKYHDIIEFVSDDHRVLTSEVQGSDGTFTKFMTAHYRRKK